MNGVPTSKKKGFQDERYRALIGKLINARKSSGLSQAELAIRLNRHQQFVSRYEIGERRLDIVEFIDISRALGVDMSILDGVS
ncbi:MAG: helix-turn-helix transcriptional regulator [Pseudomonadota bacterium]|uniref:helix-turn-helix domain-containing protein n=1 Tax=Sphingobium yanoikuyae TaxID=13690 RepID=UPI0013777183|nr:helix-turn-helix transcriptional regulator [Sphingobium yanoikuyae]NBB42239.1 helix-turn-helix domain-containing protein [Sphingobium yanoikuyae]